MLSLLLLLLGIGLAVHLFNQLRQGEILPSGRLPKQKNRFPQSKAPRNRSHSYKALLKLVNGDRRTAERLLTHLQERYPEKSEQWRIEKAIWDLRRDRRA
jgi:uncharacterized protein HemY